MGRILSIDLAYKRTRDFGICVIGERQGHTTRVRFVDPGEMGLKDPPEPKQCADAILQFCQRNFVTMVFLDAPQGWKDPNNGLEHSRICERRLNAQANTGVEHCVKPKNFTAFVEFSVALFRCLVELGSTLVLRPTIETPTSGTVLVAESYPRSAWRNLGISPLPAKRRASPLDIDERLHKLRMQFRSSMAREDATHDELCALVSGLAGGAILAGDTRGYTADGSQPLIEGSKILEGFIVNPRISESITDQRIN